MLDMRLSGLQKLTLLDYPGKTAATVFTPGCDFRCPFCQNYDLVIGERSDADDGDKNRFPEISIDAFFDFLGRRHGLLDGVCITGGEPLMQPGIEDFCRRIKIADFDVKLDTNGSFPEKLESLVGEGLIDYVAMDVKNSRERYPETIGLPTYDIAPVEASVAFLLSGAVPFEFRTTVVRELQTECDLLALAHWIEGAPVWYLQGFVDAETVLAGEGNLHAYTKDEMEELLASLHTVIPTAQLRGV